MLTRLTTRPPLRRRRKVRVKGCREAKCGCVERRKCSRPPDDEPHPRATQEGSARRHDRCEPYMQKVRNHISATTNRITPPSKEPRIPSPPHPESHDESRPRPMRRQREYEGHHDSLTLKFAPIRLLLRLKTFKLDKKPMAADIRGWKGERRRKKAKAPRARGEQR